MPSNHQPPHPQTAGTTRVTAIGAIVLALALLALMWALSPRHTPTAAAPTPLRPAPTREPLVPTPRPAYMATPTPRPILSPTPAPTAAPAGPVSVDARGRIGVGLAMGAVTGYPWEDGAPGWYLSWGVKVAPEGAPGIRFAQMVRVYADRFAPSLDVIRSAARANPGATWLLGNEPDVIWQDNATPEQYAAQYGILYPAIKAADPTAQVAIAGVSQPTPLRTAYLDRILAAYRAQFGAEMPVDVWNVHAFILREERGSWGVDIPPGMAEGAGTLYEISDHADMAVFRQQIVDFRRWMAERGLRDKPLIVSEYGILMPESYGFPADLVADFLVGTFDYFLTAQDGEIGYPADENRLVQAFCWYSVADTMYPNPNLFDPQTKRITAVGEMFVAYVAGLR